MNKFLAAFFMIVVMPAASLLAQDDNLDLLKKIDQMDADKTASPTPAPSPNPDQQPPTYINSSKGATFDSKTKVAVLYGDVKVLNPQFTLTSDKLTVYFHKDEDAPKKESGSTKQPAATPSPTPKPSASPASKPDASAPPAQQGGNIDKVVAEGNVVIVSDRPDPKGGPPVHYVGKGQKVVYTPATGEAVISDWPQLQQGINTMVATDSSTVIYLNRDGTMHADGPVKMVVTPPPPDKKTPVPDKTPEIE